VLLRGARRGEAAGLRWADGDMDAGNVRLRRPIVLVRGAVTESTPKTKTGDRLIWLDAETVRILKEHRTARLMAGEAGGGGGRESNPPATRHAALWF
jgi:integrase